MYVPHSTERGKEGKRRMTNTNRFGLLALAASSLQALYRSSRGLVGDRSLTYLYHQRKFRNSFEIHSKFIAICFPEIVCRQ